MLKTSGLINSKMNLNFNSQSYGNINHHEMYYSSDVYFSFYLRMIFAILSTLFSDLLQYFVTEE